MTNRDLIIIEHRLTERDREILRTLKETRCLFTYHIRRLFFIGLKHTGSATRMTQRTMKRLKEHGLVDVMMDRRIGGVRAGSSSFIWYLTEQGHRLLELDQKYDDGRKKRSRFTEPADSTLSHRMAVNECYVKLIEMERQGLLKVTEVSFEPDNWRSFQYKDQAEILKPDLLIATSHHNYNYRFFIEMDLSTESIDTIIKKCIRYHRYLKSGIEQATSKVFPFVLFIVKDERRRQKMEAAIQTHFKNQPDIFIISTPDEYEAIMTSLTFPEDRLC